MKLRKLWPVLMALVLVLSACGSPQNSPTAASLPATQPPAAEQPTVVKPTAVEVEAATPTTAFTPTAASTPTEVAVVDYCVECHTSKDQLVLTAKPEEDHEKESEGAG